MDQSKLKELLNYNPDTGVFVWRKDMSAKAKAGCVAGSVGGGGRAYIGINQKRHHAHRLAWLYVYGQWPEGGIEHINGNNLDNRISNLRQSGIKVPLTQKRLKELLSYCSESGHFSEVKKRRGARNCAAVGWVNAQGYRCISIDGKTYFAHRLAWLYAHGDWPIDQIDHANGDPLDNRLNNLRCSSQSENMQNVGARVDSKTGLKGIFPTRQGKWAAQIQAQSKVYHLGTFTSKEAAHDAYKKAAKELHGEFAKF